MAEPDPKPKPEPKPDRFDAGWHAFKDYTNTFADAYPGCRGAYHDNKSFCPCYESCKDKLTVDTEDWHYLNLRLFVKLPAEEQRETALQFFGYNRWFEARFESLCEEAAAYAD